MDQSKFKDGRVNCKTSREKKIGNEFRESSMDVTRNKRCFHVCTLDVLQMDGLGRGRFSESVGS